MLGRREIPDAPHGQRKFPKVRRLTGKSRESPLPQTGAASGRSCPRHEKTFPQIFPENLRNAPFSSIAMQHPETLPIQSRSNISSETDFGNIEFCLRKSNVFSVDEDEDADIGFKAPKMTLLRQSLSPLPPRAAGREEYKKSASMRAALDAYFARVGWSRRQESAPQTNISNMV